MQHMVWAVQYIAGYHMVHKDGMVRVGLSMCKYVQACVSMCKYDICKYVQVCSSMCKYVQICASVFKYVQVRMMQKTVIAVSEPLRLLSNNHPSS